MRQQDSASPALAGTRQQLEFTVQGWQNIVFGVMGAVVLAGAVTGGVLLHRTDDVSRQLIASIDPARSAAYRLQAALGDQETAVRGYIISADRQFLDPYKQGKTAEDAAVQDIRERLVGHAPLIADVDAVERASAAWRATYADPVIAGVTPGVPQVLDSEITQRGKAAFDGLRRLFDTQNQHLAQARADGRAEFEQVRGWRNTVLIALVGVFALTALALATLTQRAVTWPLAALAAACRRITEGNFGERIIASGPKDIRSIATDVEDMRQRIVAELESSLTAQTQLADQAEVLDVQSVELRRSNAELEQFAYVASHDLQEPLRKVTSFCQLLEKRYSDKLDERGLEYIGFAVDGAKRMQVLINDLLTFSRVGRLEATPTVLDLDATLEAALANLGAAIEESGADILRTGEVSPRVTGDPTLFALLWQNLVGNSIKFAREDVAPRIVIDCRRGTGDATAYWILTLSDNGIGIPPEFVDKVFVIFQRLHARTAYGGTGIGLAICKKIVEHYGGTIGIDTGYREGARFNIALPIAAGDAEEKNDEPLAVAKGAPS